MATKKATKTTKPARETRNGQKAPTVGTKGALIWANINKAAAAKGSPISFGEAIRSNPDQNPLTVGLYYPRWRKFYGVTGRIPDPIIEAAKAERQAEREAKKSAAKAERRAKAAKAAEQARIARAERIAKASKAKASAKAPSTPAKASKAKPKAEAPAKACKPAKAKPAAKPRKCRKPAAKA